MNFDHIIIDKVMPGKEQDICLISDVNGNGHNDVILGGKQGEGNIVWYEYPSWKRHTIGTANLEAGGVTKDLTGNGLPDFIAGQPWNKEGGPDLYWFENSGDPDKQWTRRIICNDLDKYHDQAIGDIDNDGEEELIIASQLAKVLAYYDLPKDPRVEPWPIESRHVIAEDIVVEGLEVADIDHDGKNELIAGPGFFKQKGSTWERTVLAPDYELTRVAAGDLNNDGKLEIVLAEGESNPARLAWVSAYPELKVTLIADDLFHPHSMALADFTGNGLLDIFVAEMGLDKNPSPKVLIYKNMGDCKFEKHVVHENCAMHEAKVGIIGNSKEPSIVGKPYMQGRSVHLWLNKA